VKQAEAMKPKDLLAAAIVENVRNTVQNISTSQPLLAPKVQGGTLKVVGAVYDVGSGNVTMV
jgi:carbonic anhydrase